MTMMKISAVSVDAARWSSGAAASPPLPQLNAAVSVPRYTLARSRSSCQVSELSIWGRRCQIQPRMLCATSRTADSSSELAGSPPDWKNICGSVIAKGIAAWILGCVVLRYGNLPAYAASAAATTSSSSPASIGTSSLGLRIAGFLRKSSWPDEAIVFALATLPVLELRGAIPVGHWMRIDPLKVYALAVAGNMVPVPLILLYLERFTTFLTSRSSSARKALDAMSKRTRRKAGPIQEFKWLGLMLFVAVPFPGTGAWTGAMASVALGMPFWSSLSANFFGVAIAGILVNLLVTLGLNTALLVGAALFAASTFMWSFLRSVAGSKQ